jgi:hypothetical protein
MRWVNSIILEIPKDFAINKEAVAFILVLMSYSPSQGADPPENLTKFDKYHIKVAFKSVTVSSHTKK